jgi:hypothetical protein
VQFSVIVIVFTQPDVDDASNVSAVPEFPTAWTVGVSLSTCNAVAFTAPFVLLWPAVWPAAPSTVPVGKEMFSATLRS